MTKKITKTFTSFNFLIIDFRYLAPSKNELGSLVEKVMHFTGSWNKILMRGANFILLQTCRASVLTDFA